MNLSGLIRFLDEQAVLATEGAADVIGLPDPAKPAFVAALAARRRGPVVVLTDRSQRAQSLADEAGGWLGRPERVVLFPPREDLPYERILPDPEDIGTRLHALRLLHEPGEEPLVVVAPARALSQRTLTLDEFNRRLALRRGQALQLEPFLRELDRLGYEFVSLAEMPGQVTRRGGIIDIFSPTAEQPYRIELWGDEIDSIRAYDPVTQRSRGQLEEAVVVPASELLLPNRDALRLLEELRPGDAGEELRQRAEDELHAIAEGRHTEGHEFWTAFLARGSLLDHLPPDALLVVDEGGDIRTALDELTSQAEEACGDLEQRGELLAGMPLPALTSHDVVEAIDRARRRISLSRFATEDDGPRVVRLPFHPAPTFGGRLRAVVRSAAEERQQGRRLVIVSHQAPRLAEVFAEEGVAARTELSVEAEPQPGEILLVRGGLAAGWTLPPANLALWTDAELFGFTKQRRLLRRRASGREAFLAELSPGDLAVHIEHGIGRFVGVVRRSIDGQEKEYLELRYAENDRLLVPIDQVDRVSRYVGPGDHTPTLTRLGSGEWARTKERVRRAVLDMARELLELYARRELAPGHAFKEDTVWQQEMEAAFPYVETGDQVTAVRAVKADMEEPQPMDRLLCGDVGFGKTEVAVRAAFKAVMDGKQVAVLAPTTVLAQQHVETFSERLASFPVHLEVLSRFRSKKEARGVVEGLKEGSVDIVIGTHRLLQQDVQFKDLGLVIIDEEQRFGVAHKERLKRMRVEVDVLTLTATPIPRTLHMALTGIRDLSTIDTPPENRLPVKTYVTEFDERLVREAILRELERGGQVYFVHNRVESIGQAAARAARLVPEASVAVGHGQLPEEELEQVMIDFSHGRIDVLVCTTIIESGLDIPNVNTIIINRADTFGLSQLYQLRGRVGRAAVRAYAYLLYEKGRLLSEVARKRLQAIFEAQELGAGFQIALRDLEIRGAGNLLGAEQSGHIAAVGFDLYARLLGDTVAQLRALQRGETPPAAPVLEPPLTVDLPLSAHIPDTYVPDLNMRLSLYQRLARITEPAEADAMRLELLDRFGKPPPAVDDLLYVTKVRALAKKAQAEAVVTEPEQIVVRFGRRGTPQPVASLPRDARAGPTQLRIERRGRDGWQQTLLESLRILQPAETAAAAG